jgi:hypothetical protein
MKTFGRYEILEEPGNGGMGAVYAALLVDDGRELRERFHLFVELD